MGRVEELPGMMKTLVSGEVFFRAETIKLKYGNTNSFFIPGEGVFEKGVTEG